jgi:hypothetical protein
VTDPVSPGQPGQPYGGYTPGGYQPTPPPQQPPQGGGYPPPYQPGSDPYGSQPPGGAEAPASPYGQPGPYGTPAPPPAKKGGAGKVIGIVVGVLVLVVVLCVGGIFGISQLNKDNASNAKVGDCLAGDSMDSTTATEVKHIKIVSCTASDAKYKVVGKVDGKTQVDFSVDDHLCDAYPTAKSALWQGETGKKGSVLCLEPAK